MGLLLVSSLSKAFPQCSYPRGRPWHHRGLHHNVLSQVQHKESVCCSLDHFHPYHTSSFWFLHYLPLPSNSRNQHPIQCQVSSLPPSPPSLSIPLPISPLPPSSCSALAAAHIRSGISPLLPAIWTACVIPPFLNQCVVQMVSHTSLHVVLAVRRRMIV